MDIVKHNELISLLKKGLGYHDQQPPNVSQALKSFESGIHSFIYKVSNKTATPIKSFSPWRYDILSRVKDKLSRIKQYTFNCILSKPEVKTELKKLHNDFAIIPTDKSSNCYL